VLPSAEAVSSTPDSCSLRLESTAVTRSVAVSEVMQPAAEALNRGKIVQPSAVAPSCSIPFRAAFG